MSSRLDPISIWREYRSDNGVLISAAIAFYVTLAIAPLGVLALSVAGIVLSEEIAKAALTEQLFAIFNDDVAAFVLQTIERAATPRATWLATAVGVAFTLYICIRLFVMLRRALNMMWGVPSRSFGWRKIGWRRFLLRRALGFSIVLMTGAVLVFSVVSRSVLTLAGRWMPELPWLWTASRFSTAFFALTVLIAFVYRWLPDAKIAWRDAWVGAAVTALMATTGSIAIGAYIGEASPASVYGAAGTLVVLLLWIYYTTQMFFLGAKFTRRWAGDRFPDV